MNDDRDHASDEYSEAKREHRVVCDFAAQLSSAVAGASVDDWHLEMASYLFSKICCHAISARKLAPSGLVPVEANTRELWDLSSICAIVRAEIDSYFALVYHAVDPVSREERELRRLLWEYHGEATRLRLIEQNRLASTDVSGFQKTVQASWRRLEAHGKFGAISVTTRNSIKEEQRARLSSSSDLARRADISSTYYKMVFDYLSCHLHAYGLAGKQLAVFRAGCPESLGLIENALNFSTAFLSVAIRDSRRLWPDLKIDCRETSETIAGQWISILSGWDDPESGPG